jgi:CRP-like cAMP-binding protein
MSDSKLFNTLEHQEFTMLEPMLVPHERSAGDVIYKEGDHAKSACFVIKGTLGVYKNEGGEEKLLTKLEKGGVIGEIALIDGVVRSATIKALTDCTLVLFKRVDFEKLLEEHPTTGIKILKTLASNAVQSLRETNDTLAKLTAAG